VDRHGNTVVVVKIQVFKSRKINRCKNSFDCCLDFSDGLWVVYGHQSESGKLRHRRPPSCILAGMNATIHLNGIENVKNTTTFIVPSNARASNHTCGDLEQRLSLKWKPKSKLSFYFHQNLNVIDNFLFAMRN
jgi:hypothetical protein